MARKRDYRAEYQRRKLRATQSGYKSVREYSATRKALGIPRNAGLAPKRIVGVSLAEDAEIRRLRRESQEWSDKHSRRFNSRYRPSLTDAQVRRYHAAFVEPLDLGTPRKTDFARRMRIRAYLVPDFLATEAEWKANPSTVPLRR